MKIMIVDNDPTRRQVIRGIVAGPEDDVVGCTDGDEVLKAFDEFHADRVLMDIQMGRMSGSQATRELRSVHPDARIAILTNDGSAEFREDAASAGAECYFLKDNIPPVRKALDA